MGKKKIERIREYFGGMGRIERVGFLAVLLFGVTMRIVTLNLVSVESGYYQHDVVGRHGHLDYIETIYETGRLPETNLRQYYHPPLHHIISAGFLKLMMFFMDDLTAAEEWLKVLAAIYAGLLLVVVWKITGEIGLTERVRRIIFLIYLVHPALMLMTISVNNDPLSILLIMESLLWLIRWWKEPSVFRAGMLGIFTGLSVMTKMSGLVLFAVELGVFMVKFFGERSEVALTLFGHGVAPAHKPVAFRRVVGERKQVFFCPSPYGRHGWRAPAASVVTSGSSRKALAQSPEHSCNSEKLAKTKQVTSGSSRKALAQSPEHSCNSEKIAKVERATCGSPLKTLVASPKHSRNNEKLVKAGKVKFFLRMAGVFMVIALPIGLWYPVRNYVKFGQELTYVLDLGDVEKNVIEKPISGPEKKFMTEKEEEMVRAIVFRIKNYENTLEHSLAERVVPPGLEQLIIGRRREDASRDYYNLFATVILTSLYEDLGISEKSESAESAESAEGLGSSETFEISEVAGSDKSSESAGSSENPGREMEVVISALSVILMVWAAIILAVVMTRATVRMFRNVRVRREISENEFGILVIMISYIVLLILGFVATNLRLPIGCTGSFRYLMPMVMASLAVVGIEEKRAGRIYRFWIFLAMMLMIISYGLADLMMLRA